MPREEERVGGTDDGCTDDLRPGCRNVSYCQQQQHFFLNNANPDDHTRQTDRLQ